MSGAISKPSNSSPRPSYRSPYGSQPPQQLGVLAAKTCLPCRHNSSLALLTKKLVIAVDDNNEIRIETLLRETEAPDACITELGPLKALRLDAMGSVLHLAAHKGYTKIVQMILDKGVYVDLRTLVDNATPFHRACLKAHMATMRLLLRRGAKVNTADKYGRTPLHLACAAGKVEAIFMLIDLGARLDIRDKRGYYASQMASLIHQNRIHQFLMFREAGGLGHKIGQDLIAEDNLQEQIDEILGDNTPEPSDIFQATRKVQERDRYDRFDAPPMHYRAKDIS